MDITKLRERFVPVHQLPSAYQSGGNALVTTYEYDGNILGLLPQHPDPSIDHGWLLGRVTGMEEYADIWRGYYLGSSGSGEVQQDLRVIKAARKFTADVNMIDLPGHQPGWRTSVCYEFTETHTTRVLVEHPHGWRITGDSGGQLRSDRVNFRRERLALAGFEGNAWWVPMVSVREVLGDVPRPPREPVEFDSLDLNGEWTALGCPDISAFREALRPMLIEDDRDLVEDVHNCLHCRTPRHSDDLTWADSEGAFVCASCYRANGYVTCPDCDEVVRYHQITNGGRRVCMDCRADHYAYCDDCSNWFHQDDEHYHEDGNGCCESAAMAFTVPFNGGTVAADERVRVSLEAGVISEVGLADIENYIRQTAYDMEMENHYNPDFDRTLTRGLRYTAGAIGDLGPEVKSDRGSYAKRLSSMAYKNYGIKVPANILAKVGTIADNNSRGSDYWIEVTRDLNQSASDFCHPDSCWWQSYYHSRCALKTNGGFGLRTFENGRVRGRVWVMPLKENEKGHPEFTFDTMTPAGYVVFNGYGNLEHFAPARIMAHMTGLSYKKIEFHVPLDDGEHAMYVNNESGYLIASEEIIARWGDSGFSLEVPQHSNLHDNERENSHAA